MKKLLPILLVIITLLSFSSCACEGKEPLTDIPVLSDPSEVDESNETLTSVAIDYFNLPEDTEITRIYPYAVCEIDGVEYHKIAIYIRNSETQNRPIYAETFYCPVEGGPTERYTGDFNTDSYFIESLKAQANLEIEEKPEKPEAADGTLTSAVIEYFRLPEDSKIELLYPYAASEIDGTNYYCVAVYAYNASSHNKSFYAGEFLISADDIEFEELIVDFDTNPTLINAIKSQINFDLQTKLNKSDK